MGRYLPYPNIALLYKSYVRPTIEYATPIWSLTLTTAQLAMFDVLQAKVCRRLLRSAKIEFDRYYYYYYYYLKVERRQKILQKMYYLRMHLRKSHHQPIRTCVKVLNVFVPFLSKYYRE